MNRSRKRRLAGLTVLLLGGVGGSAEPQAPQDPGFFRVAVNVDLVEVYATVLDRKGRSISDLRQENFEVYDDGVRQTIRLFVHEDTPVAVGLVVDHSGSVGRKLPEVIAAARAFVQASRPQDQMFVVNFNERVTLGLPAGIQFTSRADELERAIYNTPTTGQTALYDAIVEARRQLHTARLDKKVLLVISDGGDNASVHTLAEVLALAQQSSALIYTIGIFDKDDPDGNPSVLRRLARATGGEAFFPDQLRDVVTISERIAHSLRNQYTLGYAPANAAKPGAYRSIRVSASAPGYGRLSVRAREGYIAGGEPPLVKGKAAR